MVKSWGALALIVGIISLAGTTQLAEQSGPRDYDQPASAPNNDRDLNKSVAHLVEDKGRRQREKEDHWYDAFFEHFAEWLIALFNGLLVYVTYRLVTTTGDLRESTDQLWRAGRDAFEATERAFVFIDGFNHELSVATDAEIMSGFIPEPLSVATRTLHYALRRSTKVEKRRQYPR